MIRVVHIITGLGDGGAEAMLSKLLLSADGKELGNSVISLTTSGRIGRRLRSNGIRVQSLGMKSGLWNPARLIELAHKLSKQDVDIIQTWMYHANFVGGLAGKVAWGVPVVWNVRAAGLDFDGYPSGTVLIARWSSVLSHVLPERIIFNSESSRRAHVAMGYAEDRVLVIPNGFDTEEFKPDPVARAKIRTDLGISDETVLVGLVARFHPQKNHRNFIDAASILAKRHGGVRFLLCGAGTTSENALLASWIQEARLENRVHLLGLREDVSAITAALDVACSASNTESFSNTVGEAMSCGVPCVVTDVGDSAAIVGTTGFVVPPRNPLKLAEGILQLVKLDPDFRSELGKAARNRIVKEYSIEAVANEYKNLYNSIKGANLDG